MLPRSLPVKVMVTVGYSQNRVPGSQVNADGAMQQVKTVDVGFRGRGERTTEQELGSSDSRRQEVLWSWKERKEVCHRAWSGMQVICSSANTAGWIMDGYAANDSRGKSQAHGGRVFVSHSGSNSYRRVTKLCDRKLS